MVHPHAWHEYGAVIVKAVRKAIKDGPYEINARNVTYDRPSHGIEIVHGKVHTLHHVLEGSRRTLGINTEDWEQRRKGHRVRYSRRFGSDSGLVRHYYGPSHRGVLSEEHEPFQSFCKYLDDIVDTALEQHPWPPADSAPGDTNQ